MTKEDHELAGSMASVFKFQPCGCGREVNTGGCTGCGEHPVDCSCFPEGYDHDLASKTDELRRDVVAAPAPQRSGTGAHLHASLQDGKWYLTAETTDGDGFLELAWPWPGQEKSAYELREAGFEIQ